LPIVRITVFFPPENETRKVSVKFWSLLSFLIHSCLQRHQWVACNLTSSCTQL
jgi:hypothetical protein